jgi:peroxiredoxin
VTYGNITRGEGGWLSCTLMRGKLKTSCIVLFTSPSIQSHPQGCSRSHVPGFVESHDALRAKGIDQVFVVSTADGELVRESIKLRAARNE